MIYYLALVTLRFIIYNGYWFNYLDFYAIFDDAEKSDQEN